MKERSESRLVSVIIPALNRSRLLSLSVESVRRQNYTEFELLIVDDGSSPIEFEEIVRIAKSDKRIRLMRRQSQARGASVCRNEGLYAATGNYCVFLDSDDVLAPHCLDNRLQLMKSQPSLGFSVFPGQFFDKTIGDRSDLWFSETNDYIYGFLVKPIWQTTSPIWRRESVLSIGGFNPDLPSWQDWDLHVRALISGLTFSLVPGPHDFYIRRGHSNRISKSSEIELPQLIQRIDLFTNTINDLKAARKWNESFKLVAARRFLLLALQLDAAGDPGSGEAVVDSLKALLDLDQTSTMRVKRHFLMERSLRRHRSVPNVIKARTLRYLYQWLCPEILLAYNGTSIRAK